MCAQPTVLVVEDNAEMRAFLRKQLVDQYRVVVAEDGMTGWKLAQNVQPDLIVSDNQARKGQHSLCERLKKSEGLSIPLILMEDVDGRDFKADAVLQKPFSVSALHEHVDQHLPTRSFPEMSISEGGEFLREALEEIEKRLQDPDFSVQRLADLMSISRRHLTRRMKKTAQKTPAALIRERRIERAKERLAADPETIAGVAKQVGFRSPSHFSQVFRDMEDCSPSTFIEATDES